MEPKQLFRSILNKTFGEGGLKNKTNREILIIFTKTLMHLKSNSIAFNAAAIVMMEDFPELKEDLKKLLVLI